MAQSILCDICQMPISAQGVEMHRFWGDVVRTEGNARLVHRMRTEQYFLCTTCADWMEAAQKHLTASVRKADT